MNLTHLSLINTINFLINVLSFSMILEAVDLALSANPSVTANSKSADSMVNSYSS